MLKRIVIAAGLSLALAGAALAQVSPGSGPLPISKGGTAATSASAARTSLGLTIGTFVEAWDADLDALAALNSTGFPARTASNAWAQRSLAAPAAGLTITNPAGVAGNPTFALANDLAALEGLASTGIAVRTATDTWAQRTITGTANEICATNGNGVSGNPTLGLCSALTFTGKTVTGGTYSGGSLSTVTVQGATFQDPTDTTKKATFNLAAISPGNTRSYTLPDATGDTFALLAAAQTLTNKDLDTATNTFKISGSQVTAINGSLQISGTTLRRAALSGDVTAPAGGNTTTLANIPDGVPMAGSVLATAIAAPSTPAAGKSSLWVDSTTKRLRNIDDSGAIGTTAVAKSSVSHQWLNAMGTNGVFTSSQPASSDLSDVAALAKLNVEDQSLTGGVNVTAKALSTGGITVDCGARPLQTITNGGSFTITAPANDGSCAIKVTNNASAGVVSFSGFSVGSNTGDALDTTNGHKFFITIMRIGGDSTYRVGALQ